MHNVIVEKPYQFVPQRGSRFFRKLIEWWLPSYPPDYIRTHPSAERSLETVEWFEEDLTGKATLHSPIHAVIQVGEALEANPDRDREAGGTGDALMQSVRVPIDMMLQSSANEAKLGPGAL